MPADRNEAPPRILVITFLFPSRVYPNRGIFVLRRLQAVQRHAEVTVINPVQWFPFCGKLERYRDHERIPRRETIEGIDVYHPRFFFLPRYLKVLDCFTYCLTVLPLSLRLRKKWKFQLIDLHWTYPDLLVGRVLAKLLGLKQLVTIRGRKAFHADERTLRRAITRRLLATSDHVIALSEGLKDECLANGVDEQRISIVYNGVDRSTFHPLDRESCRQRLGVEAGCRMILGVGTLTPVKGFDRLIAAFPAILASHPGAQLFLVGPGGSFAGGDDSRPLRALIKRHSLEGKVHLAGEVENRELAAWYNAADCFCLPSRSEGCPNVLLEALACGCPAVATDVGAVSELMAGAKVGIVVENSEKGIQSGLITALSKNWERGEIASYVQRFSWERCAESLLEIYQRFASGDGAATRSEAPPSPDECVEERAESL